MIRKVILKDFSGGIAVTSEKKDIPFSARFVKNLDPFQDPTYITLSKKATKVSGTTVTGLVYWMEDGSPYDTNRYFYDSSGGIYRETNAGVWSRLANGVGAGQGLKVFDDYLYFAQGTNLGRYGKLSGTPELNDDFGSWWAEAISDIETTGGGTGATDYVPPTSISEVATARQTFTVTHDPLYQITINVDVKGTGAWTLTLHDNENNLIASSTRLNTAMSVGDVPFFFPDAVRVTIGTEYHFHVTSTVADGGVDTNVDTDLEGAEFTARYNALIDKDFHPMVAVEDKLIIGNGEYLAVFDQATYNPNKILLDKGFDVRTMDKTDEYVVVGCYKGATIDGAEESRIFYWDTISPSWNFFTDSTSIGACNAITNSGNVLRGIYGNKGCLYEGDRPFQKKNNSLPKLTAGKKVNIYPSAITNLDGRTLIGVGSTDDGTGLEQGIYTFGSQDDKLQDVFVLSHTISSGTTQSATVEIGFVKAIGDEVYWGWRDNTTYGVDKISNSSLAVASGVYEGLIFDNGEVDKEKLAITLVAKCNTLATNEGLSVKHKIDRTTSFTSGTGATSGDKEASVGIYKRFGEIEFGFTVTSIDGTYPKVTELSLEFNDLEEEK